MASIISSFQKLFEHYIVSYINTGDRILDTLLIAFVISIVSYIFSFDYKKHIGIDELWNLKEEDNLTPQQREFIVNNYMRICWNKSAYKDFTDAVKKEFSRHAKNQKFIDIKTCTTRDSVSCAVVTTQQIYRCKDRSFVYLYPLETGFGCYIKSMSNFIEFRDYIISKYKCKLYNEIPNIRIYKDELEIGSIYENRTFDNMVSKHIPTIKKYLDKFMDPNKSPFESHNLGIMFYGPPGTGKTSYMRAICNYLQRSMVLVDMDSVKTTENFRNVLEDKQTVVCIEEIDLIPGVFTRHSEKKSEHEMKENKYKDKEIERLYAEHMELLKANQTPEIAEKIKQIKKEISNCKNRLDLAGVLTALDGPIERRNSIILASTNHIEDLDPALFRTGRFDLKVYLGHFTSEEIVEYLEKFFSYKNVSEEDLKYMRKNKFPDDTYTPADIADICKRHDTLRDVVDKLKISS